MTPSIITPDTPRTEAPASGTIALPWFIASPDTARERRKILAGRYFLVRSAGGPAGEIWVCGRCGGKHRYFTLMCKEQPFSGLTNGLYAFWHVVGANDAQTFLSDAQRVRLRELSKLFGPSRNAPDLSTSHPETARKLATAETDVDMGALALGILEPITRAEAQRYADRINNAAGRHIFTLPGLTG
jgi:hypothetical protein